MRFLALLSVAGFVSLAVYGCTGDSSDNPAPTPSLEAGALDVSAPDVTSPTGDDAAPDATGAVLEACPTATGAGTEHKNDITADEVWTLAGSPHRITYNARILSTVRVEPCATVLIDEGFSITLGNTPSVAGTLIAKGERGVDKNGAPIQRPVTFAAADPTKPWGSIFVNPAGKLDLENVILRDGANPSSDQNGGGVVVAYGNGVASGAVVKSVRAVDVAIDKSRGYGFNFQVFSGFTDDSSKIAVTNSGRDTAAFPIRLLPGALSTVPTVTLVGNTANEVEIIADNTAIISDTIKSRGVPYRVMGRMRVAPVSDGAAVSLTIEAGVTLRFDTTGDSGLLIGSSDLRQGILIAEGTVAAPITFTSGKPTPAPGDWKNIYFAYTPNSGNKLTNAIIEYAGGFSGAQGYGCGPAENDASILILSGRPNDAFIQNTSFKNGGGDTGLLLGWSSDQTGPDFVATNTFTSMPACKVSRWRNVTGVACPGSTAGSPVCLP